MRLTSQLGTFTLHFRGTDLLLLQARQVPDQISRIFFGWAKLERHGISEVVVSIGWDLSLRTVQRVMSAKRPAQDSPLLSSDAEDTASNLERTKKPRNPLLSGKSTWIHCQTTRTTGILCTK